MWPEEGLDPCFPHIWSFGQIGPGRVVCHFCVSSTNSTDGLVNTIVNSSVFHGERGRGGAGD